MIPYYWESQHGNFGDDLNLWLWDYLLPGFRNAHPDTLLVGVGTVLNSEQLPAEGHKLVLGSGYGYGVLPDMSDRSKWDIRCVRGPLTAKRASLSAEMGIIDPAVVVADMPEFRGLPKIHRKSFVPHWETAGAGIWATVCESVGLHYIDPRGDAKFVIREIAQSDMIVAESMHGAILADAFRVPWVAVTTSQSINSFKWNDWAQTVGVSYAPCKVPVSTRAEAIMKGAKFWGLNFENKRANAPEMHNNQLSINGARTEVLEKRESGLRLLAKRVLATPSSIALWQASRANPQLSADSRLSERKSRFMSVIEGVRRDYL